MGGRAFGTDASLANRRAAQLGADAWAPTAREAASVLTRWKASPSPIGGTPTAVDMVALRLTEEAHALALAALPRFAELFPPMADYDQPQLDTTLENLDHTVRFLGAAIMVDDRAVLTDFLTWLQDLLVHRGVPSPALPAGLLALRPLVKDIDTAAAVLLDVGRRMLVDGASDRAGPVGELDVL
jgi:hypothetical protein